MSHVTTFQYSLEKSLHPRTGDSSSSSFTGPTETFISKLRMDHSILPKVDWELNSFLYIRFFPKSIKKYKYNNTILAISVPYKVASVFVSLKANPLAYSWFFYIYIYFQPNMHQVGSVASHRQRLHPSCPAGLWAVTKLNLLIPSEQLNSQSSCSARQLKMFTLCLWIIGHYCSREMKPELIPTASFPNYAS